MSLPCLSAPVEGLLSNFDLKAALANDKTNVFSDPEAFPAIQKSKDLIVSCLTNLSSRSRSLRISSQSGVERELDDHLRLLRKQLKRPSLAYSTVSGIDYLIEVKVTDGATVPSSWSKISATKTMQRYHTPEALKLIKVRSQQIERLDQGQSRPLSPPIKSTDSILGIQLLPKVSRRLS